MRLSAIRLLQFRNPGQGGPMIVKMTYLSGLSQMPFRYYFKTGLYFRYFVYSNFIVLGVCAWISSKVNSPAAVAAWEAKKKADHEKEHIEHMWRDISGWYANK